MSVLHIIVSAVILIKYGAGAEGGKLFFPSYDDLQIRAEIVFFQSILPRLGSKFEHLIYPGVQYLA